jgi:hypothetical protein
MFSACIVSESKTEFHVNVQRIILKCKVHYFGVLRHTLDLYCGRKIDIFVNREIMELYNSHDELTEWRKMIGNLYLHPHCQNHLPSILKHFCNQMKYKTLSLTNILVGLHTRLRRERTFLLIILSK